MKYKFSIVSLGLPALLLWLLAGCSSGDGVLPGTEPENGEAVSLSFSLCRYTTDVEGGGTTRAEGGAAATRAESTVAQDMAVGKTFRVYAYPAGATDLTSPKATAVYTVVSAATSNEPAKATGELYLYRGAYDLYLLSYNMESETPELTSGTSDITTGNGKDFMYTVLKNVWIQANNVGANKLDIELPDPFKRMGAQVKVMVKGKDGSQPVRIYKIEKPNYITIKGLPTSLTYGLGKTAWNEVSNPAGVYTASYSFSGFTSTNENDYVIPWESKAEVLLPVDGTVLLDFDVNLTVLYEAGTKTRTASYPASIQKTLLPGMTYEFEFSLTFYGVLSPSDLTLAVKEYNTVSLSSDGMGKG